MALAVQTQVSDGSLTTIQVGIDFFAQDDVQVYLDLAGAALVAGVDYTWTASKTITFPSPVANGSTVFLLRQTQVDEMLNIFDGGAGFTRYTLDENFRQILLLAQEVREGVGLRGIFLPLDMNGYPIKNLGNPTADTDAANLAAVKALAAQVTSGYQAADANLQAQLTGNVPLEASAFSPISWHDQVIQNSVVIPPNKNAWSFGPQMTIAEGQSVTVGEGSAWTIALGDTYEDSINMDDFAKKADLAAAGGAGLVGYSQLGTGALTRTLLSKVRESVSADDFGAVQDQNVDSGAAIQAALDSGATVINLPGAGYRSNQKLQYKFKGQVLRGANISGTSLLLATGSNDGILCTGLSGCGIENLKIAGVSNTAGALLAVENSSGFHGTNIRVEGGYNGIRFHKINACKLTRFVVADLTGTYAIRFSGDSSFKSDVLNLTDGEISHFSNPSIYGIHWQSYAHSLSMTNVRVIRGGRGLFAENSSGDAVGDSYPSFLQMVATEFDFSSNECIRLDCMRDAWIVNLYAHGSINASNIFVGADTVGVRLAVPRSASAKLHGIYLAGKAMQLMGGHFYSNSQGGAGVSNGIHVGATTNGLRVVGVISGNENGVGSATQGYGIYEEAGATNVRYSGEFGGNVTANMLSQSDKQYEIGGTFRHVFRNGGGTHFEVGGSASPAVNSIRAVGGVVNNPPQLLAQGADANIDLKLVAKGTGRIRFGTFTASADAAVTGYVEIKDDATGTVRKLAVIA